MLESLPSAECILGTAWSAGTHVAAWAILGVPGEIVAGWAVAAAIGGAIAALIMRSRARPARRICQNLSRMSSDIQSDLSQLQLESTCGQLGAGWNRLIEEVAIARRDLESLQVREPAGQQTPSQHETRWSSQLLNQIPYGLITVADDWRITFANSAAERMLGVARGGLTGRQATEFFARDLSHITPKAGIAIHQISELKSSSTLVRISAVASISDGERAETALLLHDVTQERERECERSQFLYHVTHELRTPLTNIRAYAETLSEGVLKDSDTVRECYNVIVGETQRLSRLVEDILSLSQMEAGAARIKMDDVDTAKLVRQVVAGMQAQADDKDLELILTMPLKVPVIRGNKERLAVVLTNIVGNAIKYTPARGKVEVTCSEESSRLRIKVADTGLGISPEEQEKVFEKFYRSTDERVAVLPGTGLGLALASEIVRTHGGTITLESEIGTGSTFEVVLPIGHVAATPT